MPLHYTVKNLFFADVLRTTVTIPDQFYIPIFIINALIIWLIAGHFLKGKTRFIPILIYLLSPWVYYLTLAHSFYVFLLFPTLLTIHGLLLVRGKNRILGNITLISGLIIGIYSSINFLLIVPLIFSALILFKIVPKKDLKTSLLITTVLLIPLFLFTIRNVTGFRNSLSNEIQIFSDPGLLNTVNRYQGAAAEKGYKNLARLSENKYLFFSEYFVLKYISQLMPVAFFTPQYKLLGFSFSPPIILGFIIPFAYGLYKLLQNSRTRKILLISTILTIPSILAKDIVSLNRLILFFPIIIFVISQGIFSLLNLKGNIIGRIFLAITIIFVIFQIAVISIDVKTRESLRLEKYLGSTYEIKEQ